MKTNENIKIDKESLDKIVRRHGIIFLILFGSEISGKKHKESDLDIAVLLSKTPAPEDFFSLFNSLSDIFSGKLHLVVLNETDILFRHNIVVSGKLLYGDPLKFSRYRLLTHKMYLTDMPKITRFYDKILENNQERLGRSIYGR